MEAICGSQNCSWVIGNEILIPLTDSLKNVKSLCNVQCIYIYIYYQTQTSGVQTCRSLTVNLSIMHKHYEKI